MNFGLNESQEILKESARKFFAGECPISEVRRLMETETAFDANLWAKLAEQGYTGIIFPEESGGIGLGIRATVALLEAAANWDPAEAQMTGANGKLKGEKLFVPDAAVADWIVVVAKNGVFLVDAKASGLRIAAMQGMDLTRKLYSVQFDNTPAEKIGETSGTTRALDVATVALGAELVGGLQRTLDLTVEYAKTRKQFGKPIGMFQAVQHHCADMYLETESSRSAVYYAAWALQENAPDAASAASIAKMYASDAARTVGNRGIQVHGGMGFTWENDLHLYYRRAKASETALGDATFHRERIARLVIDSGAVSAQKA